MAGQNNSTLFDTYKDFVIDFGDICRFCLKETKNNISVNDKCLCKESKDSEPESVFNFITKLRIVEVESFKIFSSKICENCYEMIQLFYNFSQVCQKSDSLLRKYYENTVQKTKVQESFSGNTDSHNNIQFIENKIPEVVQWAVGDIKQANNFLNSSQKDSVHNQRQNLKLLASESITSENTNQISTNKLLLTCPQRTYQKTLSSYSSKTGNSKIIKVCKNLPKNCGKSFDDIKRIKWLCNRTNRIPELDLAGSSVKNGEKQYVDKTNSFCFKSMPHKHLQIKGQYFKYIKDCYKKRRASGATEFQSPESELTEEFLKYAGKQSVDKINLFCVKCIPFKHFQSKSQFVKHMIECCKKKQSKSDEIEYHCFLCTNAKFSSRLNLKQHLLKVHELKEEDIMCNDEEFKTPEVYVCMKQKKSKDSEEKTVVTSRLEDLDNPEGIHDSICNCSECSAAYSRNPFLNCQTREKHNQVNSGATKCPECSESFLTNRRLIQHGIKVHQKYFAFFHHVFKKILHPEVEEEREKSFECDNCQRKYIYKTSLRKHILAAHLGRSKKGAVSCSYCGKTFSNKLNLTSHIEFVHEALFVSCPICKKKINFKTIGRHYKTHTTNADLFPGSNHLCNLCGKVLKTKRSFEDHQKLHKNIRDEICDVCGSGFTTKKLLRLHKKTHEGVARKMFACDQCQKVFSGRHTLNRHLLTHSGKKNFICEICSKCFYTLQELNRHVRHHKKDYKFDCQLCDMRFLCKSTFRHHMMKHRNVRPHKCQFCDKMFIQRAKMNSHMAAKHNVEVHNTKTVWKDPKTYVPLDELL